MKCEGNITFIPRFVAYTSVITLVSLALMNCILVYGFGTKLKEMLHY